MIQNLFTQAGLNLTDQQIADFHSLLHLFQEWNNKLNLSAIREEEDIIKKHFIDSLLATKHFDFTGKRILDLGTGGGFPSLPLGIWLKARNKEKGIRNKGEDKLKDKNHLRQGYGGQEEERREKNSNCVPLEKGESKGGSLIKPSVISPAAAGSMETKSTTSNPEPRTSHFITALDSVTKKLTAVQAMADELKIPVQTINGRAEDYGQNRQFREQFDLVITRAVAKWPTLLEITLPFVRVGGKFIAYQGPAVRDDLHAFKNLERRLGGQIVDIIEEKLFGSERIFVVIEKIKRTPKTYPRANGVPKKEPLG